MPGRVARGMQDADPQGMIAPQFHDIAVLQAALHGDAAFRQPRGGRRVRLNRHAVASAQRFRAGDMVLVVVREPDGAQLAAPPTALGIDDGAKALSFLVPRRAGIHHDQVATAQQEGIRVRRRRQRADRQRDDPDRRPELDRPGRVGFARLRAPQFAGAPLGAMVRQNPERGERGLREERFTALPAKQRFAGSDPLAGVQLARHHARLAGFALGPPQQEECRVEPDRR